MKLLTTFLLSCIPIAIVLYSGCVTFEGSRSPNVGNSNVEYVSEVKPSFVNRLWAPEAVEAYFPCEFTESTGSHALPKGLETKEYVFSCDFQTVKYSIRSRRSKKGLSDEFEALQKAFGAKRERIGPYETITNIVNLSGDSTTGIDGGPLTTASFSKVTKKRAFLIEKSRIVNLEVECSSSQEGYCENFFGAEPKDTTIFFDSLKIK